MSRTISIVFSLMIVVGCKGRLAVKNMADGGDLYSTGEDGQTSQFMKNAEAAKYALKSGLLTSQFAKEVCSCVFVDEVDWGTCKGRTSMYGSSALVDLEFDEVNKTVKAFGREDRNKALIAQFFPDEQIEWNLINPPFVAQFRQDHPELGCRLITPIRKEANR